MESLLNLWKKEKEKEREACMVNAGHQLFTLSQHQILLLQ